MTTIENRRFGLMVAVGVILFLLYQAWQKDFAPKPVPSVSAPADEAPAPTVADVPTAPAAPGAQPGTPAAAPAPGGERIVVHTDVMTAVISTQGGDLRQVELVHYPVAKQHPDKPVSLLDDRDGRWFAIQSGLTSAEGAIVSHRDLYSSAAKSYALAEGADSVEVPLEFTDAQHRTVRKTWRFHRGSYVIDLSQQLVNGGTAPVSAHPYVQLSNVPFSAGQEPPFTKPFSGVGLYEQKGQTDSYRFHKLAYKDVDKLDKPLELQQKGGWIAMLQHYFFAAVIPPQDEALTLVAKTGTHGYLGQYVGAAREVAPGAQAEFTARVYAGPKLQQTVGSITPGLELTIDYGWLTAVAKPLFWLLNWFHTLTGNWGVAIILMTFAVKGAMFKLSEAQYRGMAKMKKYAPRIQDLKERYGDDRERLHKAMMEMYKKEKFNPLAGCWPLLIQFPVFIALYWVLQESVELRQADFAFWLHDLSSQDPYYVMPVLFGITMFVQQKLSGNMSMDPMQQRVMSVMPVMLTVFFAFFPVGLVLYWFVSNLIGIAQQWYITRKLAGEGLSHR